MDKIKVTIADDHPAFREGLQKIIDDQDDIDVIATSIDGEEAVRVVKELLPDVALIDVAMPKLNGIEAAKKIRESCPRTAIIMLSAFDYEPYVLAAIRMGAAGYLLKNTPVADLLNAIRMVHNGQIVFNLKDAKDILRDLAATDKSETKGHCGLGRRELQLLKLAAKGKGNKDIATELTLSELTVQTHFANIYSKLGVGSRTEAVLYGIKKGWITLDELS